MARVAYFDCFSGCSGDMIIGSLLDAGLDLEVLRKGLAGLDFHGYQLSAEKVSRMSIAATSFNVVVREEAGPDHEHAHSSGREASPQRHRGLSEILGIIEAGHISDRVKKESSRMFRRLGEVEAGIHGVPLEDVHFHELGAVDTIVDIVGTLLALEALKIERVYSSPLAVGNGTVNTAHGVLPVPAPATLQILATAGSPIIDSPRSEKPPGELVTPTGAILITSLASSYKRPDMKVDKVGYGAGNRQFPTWPNVVRVWIGEEGGGVESPEMVLLETNIDDMNPQIYGYVMEKLLAAGAADVWLAPIQMKKNRPAVMLSVLGAVENETVLTELIMKETSTLGIRVRRLCRHTAQREIIEFASSLGMVHMKIKRFGTFLSVSPEYDDCRRIALGSNLPFQEVFRVVENEARLNLTTGQLK
jgi:pyridinium-3,5-bisthiocarboxylic acid mononucleotide nickel chelatase